MSNLVRRPIVAANWKMNSTPNLAARLAQSTLDALGTNATDQVDVVLCPSFVCLDRVRAVLASGVALGAQNMHWQDNGAFTGEISPTMLEEICTYVLIGHSERRQYFGETDVMVHRKVLAALEHGLIPIVCCGESLAQREAGETHEWVALQIRGALHGLEPAKIRTVVLAYEPIWAIGTGVASSGNDANTVARGIRAVLGELAGKQVAEQVRIQYGGSVTAGNAAEFLNMPDIDGALVGGASLKPAEFAAIVRATTLAS